MWGFLSLSITLFFGLVFFASYMKREEIMANWSKYKTDPFFMFAAPMFKPDSDPRSRIEFATDNFKDAVLLLLNKVFLAFLEPVFKIFKIFSDSLVESLSGLFNIKALLAKMWGKFNEMSDIFMRRFHSVFHQFRLTFIKLFSSMEKTFGIAVSSVYAGLSTIHTMTSFLDLVIKIIIIILVILVVMVILLFFVLMPFIPMILSVVAIVGATAMGGAVGGMASAFCFQESTRVLTAHGTKAIETVEIGDVLSTGGRVLGTMKFQASEDYAMYRLNGVVVSGTHIVFTPSGPCHVANHPDAVPTTSTRNVYCLITSDHTIPVWSEHGEQLFADWEELEDSELPRWHAQVWETLNPGAPYVAPTDAALESEAVFSATTRVATPKGSVPISDIHPGDYVMDVEGTPTRVTGCVRVAPSEVQSALAVPGGYASSAAWMKGERERRWIQPQNTIGMKKEKEKDVWYSLFTEAGTFRLEDRSARDFTDMGERLSDTYDWVLTSLLAKTKNIMPV